MKKLLFISVITCFLFSCNTEEKKEATTGGDDMSALYDQHLAVIKSNLTAFENKDMDALFSNVADDVTWNSPVYGDTVQTKAHWRESLQYWVDNWDNLKLSNAIYLPGVDTATNKPDGSVRYYGQWDGVHKATGKATTVQVYEFYNFNADHKVKNSGSFFDVGGLMNAVTPKE